MNRTSKQVLKPLFHLGFISLMFLVFVCLNLAKVINADTTAPDRLSAILGFILSYRSILALFLGAILSLCAYVKYRNSIYMAKKLRTISFFIMGMVTGKFYTWSAFFFAWGVASHFVDYIKPFPHSFGYGALSMAVGLSLWYMYCGVAIYILRQRSSHK